MGDIQRKRSNTSMSKVVCHGGLVYLCGQTASGSANASADITAQTRKTLSRVDALCAVVGGTPAQVESAAEVGMVHHLRLTCDPIGGRVQIPCIERNAAASVKAINAARRALHGDGSRHVSLVNVIKTICETGADMMTKYKETSRGGLAVDIVVC